MNCKDVRGHLLQAERPERPPAAVAEHLGQCSPCRQWHQRLVQLEQTVPLLPVPPTNAKAALLERIVNGKTAPRGRSTAHKPSRVHAFFQSPALPPAVLAASLLVFACVWWLLQAGPRERGPVAPRAVTMAPKPPPPDPLLADLMQHNVRLAKADSPQERIVELADMADRLHSTARTLAATADAEDLAKLTELYRKVVEEGVVAQAKSKLAQLPRAERWKVLDPIAARLAKTQKEAQVMAVQATRLDAINPWQDLASAARTGTSELRALLEGEAKP
jgi:hypothetical protein